MTRPQWTEADKERLGRLIRLAREERGWSRYALTLRIREAFPGQGLSLEALRLIETGESLPQPRTMAKIRRVLPEVGRSGSNW